MKTPKHKTLKNRLFSGSGWAIFTMFVWKLIENGLENIIVITISNAMAVFITQVLSTLAIITATQGTKIAIKRFLTPLIRELTYKEGNDKMNKIKQFFYWVYSNKCTIGGIFVGALTAVSGANLVDISSFLPIMIGEFNLTPVLYYCLLGLLTILCSFFPETIEKFQKRINEIKNEKEEKNIEKIAQKELEDEEKLKNQTQVEEEKAQAKAEADAKEQAEKEQAEKELRAKIDAKKAELIAKANNNNSST